MWSLQTNICLFEMCNFWSQTGDICLHSEYLNNAERLTCIYLDWKCFPFCVFSLLMACVTLWLIHWLFGHVNQFSTVCVFVFVLLLLSQSVSFFLLFWVYFGCWEAHFLFLNIYIWYGLSFVPYRPRKRIWKKQQQHKHTERIDWMNSIHIFAIDSLRRGVNLLNGRTVLYIQTTTQKHLHQQHICIYI